MQKPKKRWIGFTLLILGAPALLIYQPSLLRRPLTALLSHATGLEWRIDGDFDLGIGLSPHLVAENITLANPDSGNPKPIARVTRFEGKILLGALLLKRELRFPLLSVDNAEIVLQRNHEGRSNWAPPEVADSTSTASSSWRIREIEKLSLNNIKLDYAQPNSPPVTALIDYASLTLGASQGVQLDANVMLNDHPLAVTISSDIPNSEQKADQPLPFSASVQAANGQLETSGTLGWPLRQSAETRLESRLWIADLNKLTRYLVNDSQLPLLGEFELQTTYQGTFETSRLEISHAKLGDSQLSGLLTLDTRHEPPRLSVNILLDKLTETVIGALRELLGPSESSSAKITSVDWSALRRIEVENSQINLRELHLGGHTFSDIRLETSLALGRLFMRLHPTNLFAKKLEAKLSLDASGDTPFYEISADAEALDLAALINMFVKPPLEQMALAQLNVTMSGSLKGNQLRGIDDLNLTATGLHLAVGNKESTRTLALREGSVKMKHDIQGLQVEAMGKVDQQPLDFRLNTGPVTEKTIADELSIDLGLSSGSARLNARGKLSSLATEMAYALETRLRSSKLSDLNGLSRLNLPDIGPFEATISIRGGKDSLAWNAQEITLDRAKAQTSGKVTWSEGAPEYKLSSVVESDRAHLLSALLLPELPEVGPLRAKFELSGNQRALQSHITELRLGTSIASGTVDVKFDGPRPSLSIDIDAQRLQLADLFIGARDDLTADDSTSPYVIPDFSLNTAPLQTIDLQLKTHIHNLLQEEHHLGEYTLSSRLREGKLISEGEIHSAYAAKIHYQSELFERAGKPFLKMALTTDELDYGGLLAAFNVSEKVAGKLDLQLDMEGSGQRFRELLASGSGSLLMDGSGGMIDIDGMRLWGGEFFKLFLPRAFTGDEKGVKLICMAGRYRLSAGVFASEGIVLDTDQTTIGGAVQIKLPSEELKGVFQPKPKGIRLATLDAPITLGGTLAQPQVQALSGETLIALGKIATGLVNPAYLVVLSGSLGTSKNNPCKEVLDGDVQSRRPTTRSVITDSLDVLGNMLPKTPPESEPGPPTKKAAEDQFINPLNPVGK